MGFSPFSPAGMFAKVADTGVSGFALQNGTPTILSYTTPNDGRIHLILITLQYLVTSGLTGGALGGGGTINIGTLVGSNLAAGTYGPGAGVENYPIPVSFALLGGQMVTLTQLVAVTAGAGTVYAQILST